MFTRLFRQPAFAGMALIITLLLQSSRAQACSSCGCTLNSDWSSQGYSASSGVRVDLREDYYDQAQLRSGTSSVDRNTLEIPNEQEIQQDTLNRNTILGVDYSPSRLWGVHVELPYFNRFHTTIAEGDTDISTSHSTGIGDVRITVRYQGFSSDLNWGVQAGLKLPSGKIDDSFIAGPQTGQPLDRGLQTGTGTTDLIVGVYKFGNLGGGIGYFTQATLQQPLHARDDFKPGVGLNLNAGLRYLHSGIWSPQLQLNVRFEGRESGDQADSDNSGATLAYLSPGISAQFTAKFQVFTFFQVPVYQRVNGLQMQPAHLYSLGMQYKF